MFSKILCATDFSASATQATSVAASVARAFAGSLELVSAWTVYDELNEYAIVRPEALDEWRRKREEKLKKAVETLAQSDVRVKGTLLQGEAATAIPSYAATEKADLLVVGTEARRGIAHALLGSVAEQILRTATVPVLTVPRECSARPDADGRFAPKSIVVPIDAGPLSAYVLGEAVSLANRAHARVTAVYAWDAMMMPDGTPMAAETAQQMEARFAHWMKTHATHLPVHVTPVVRRGRAFEVIADIADEQKADLVVMATAGRSGLEHFMLGSVTERVLRQLGRPVLTYRREKNAS